MKTTTKIFMLALANISISAFAQSGSQSMKSDIKVSALLQSGCLFSAQDINFGNLNPSDTSARTTEARISLKCSKGTSLRLTTDSKSYSGTPIYLNGIVNSDDRKFFYYFVTPFTGTIPNVTISQGHLHHGIVDTTSDAHSTTITLNTTSQVDIPLVGNIKENQINTGLFPGVYRTSLTYTITY